MENKSSKKELAIQYHDNGYNCCQAVLCAFSEEIGEQEEVLFRAGEGFGLGTGDMQGTCGALSAAILLAGLKNSGGAANAPLTKADTYRIAKQINQLFLEKCGSRVCRELKGLDTKKVLRSCPDCIRSGVEVVQEVLGL